MFLLNKDNFGSARSQIDIEEIKEGLIKFKSNNYRMLLKTSSINFELKSEDERDALIDIYQSLLNSIGFSIQILIRTRELDMADYLNQIDQKINLEKKSIYKNQIKNHKNFVKSLVKDNKILSRQFYIIIPFNTSKKTDFNLVKEQLDLRGQIVTKNLNRIGIVSRQINSSEVIDLFYSFYSPSSYKNQPLKNLYFDDPKSLLTTSKRGLYV